MNEMHVPSLINTLTPTPMNISTNLHRLVIKALEPMDDDRKCFRLIGGVLVERTKKEVYPAVVENLQYIEQLSENFLEQLKSLEQAALDFRKEHNLTNQQQQQQQPQEKDDVAPSAGLLV